MNTHFDHMGSVFRKAYRELTLEPSEAVWNQISTRLDQHERGNLFARMLIIILFFIFFPLYLQYPGVNHVLSFSNTANTDSLNSSRPVSPALSGPDNVNATVQKLRRDVNVQESLIFDTANTVESFHLQHYHRNINTSSQSTQMVMDFLPASSVTAKDLSKWVKIKSKRSWALSATISTGRTRYRIDNDLPSSSLHTRQLNEMEEPESSYSVSITVEKLFSESFGWQSGIIYSLSTISVNPQHIYAMYGPQGDIAYKFNVSSGYAFIKPAAGVQPALGDSVAATEAEHEFQAIGIPIKLLYQRNIGRFTLKPAVGIVANVVTKSILETEVEDGFNSETVNVSELKGTRSFYWSLIADAEVQYRLKKDYHLHFRPSINFGISSITENHEVEAFPTDLRIGIGITRKF